VLGERGLFEKIKTTTRGGVKRKAKKKKEAPARKNMRGGDTSGIYLRTLEPGEGRGSGRQKGRTGNNSKIHGGQRGEGGKFEGKDN